MRGTRCLKILPVIAAGVLAACDGAYDPPEQAEPTDTIAPAPKAPPVPGMEDPDV
jgi:hypothetical protein